MGLLYWWPVPEAGAEQQDGLLSVMEHPEVLEEPAVPLQRMDLPTALMQGDRLELQVL
jgi:hypothetical protein